jgi:hypothetical protein
LLTLGLLYEPIKATSSNRSPITRWPDGSVLFNENFPIQTVEELRRLGHDLLTSLEAGNANQAISDSEVLAFANAPNRILLTLNRRHFIRLHHRGNLHAGIIACTFDPDFQRLAAQIHDVVARQEVSGRLFRVNRPG